MSIRTNPMKAVPVLLKRVKTARSKFMERGRDKSFDGKLEKLTRVLNKIEDVFMKVKKNQDALLDTLHEVDSHLRRLDRKRLNEEMDDICKRINHRAHKLLPKEDFESESSDDPSSTQQYNHQLLLPQPEPPQVDRNLLQDMENGQLRDCLVYLSIFPEDAVIKKRQAIYFWIGMGYIAAEEKGEDVIEKLLELNVIVPYGNGKCPTVNKFQLNPHFGPQLDLLVSRYKVERLGSYLQMPRDYRSLILEQKKVTLGHEVESVGVVYNISANYLNFGSKWKDKLEFLEVLHLGRWQDSASHHIEVGSEEFQKDLRRSKKLRYLSLRGISRIFELPPSIAQIKSLKILDLKACHNLETLPDDISSMTSLTHLILSESYLLDGMPKGIEKLTQLQVLKGFIFGSSRNTPCTISDLAKLQNLRRLSIHIRSEALINTIDFGSLGKMSGLEHLKISWGVSDIRYSNIQISLPSSLKKLHLQGFPGQVIPEWLKPSKIRWTLKELNITGGKLESMNHDEYGRLWGIQIVRLKYLKHLKVDLPSLPKLFPMLKYIELRKISNHSYIELGERYFQNVSMHDSGYKLKIHGRLL